jgi:predicted nicotinamide N-methyase
MDKNMNEIIVSKLLFSEFQELKNKFDIILASDILFFEKFHSDLIQCIEYIFDQNEDAVFLTVNKERGNSIKNFLEKISKSDCKLNLKQKILIDAKHPEFCLIMLNRGN